MLNRARSEAGFSLVELVIVIGILGILASLVYPNFLRYRAQSQQSEAKANLAGIFTAEWAYYAENLRYSDTGQIGFTLSGNTNRYTYRTHATDTAGADAGVVVINAKVGVVQPENTVVASASTNQGFTASATANLDTDVTIDQWHINDRKIGITTADTNDALQ